jgi:hypothetical protein
VADRPEAPLPSVAAALAALLFLTYAYFFAAPSWNENSRFALTRSIVERGRLDIDPYQHETGDKSFARGHHYSDKAPGTSLLAVPPYAAFYASLRLTGGRPPSSIAVAGPADPSERILVNASFRRGLYVCNLFTNALAGALLAALFFLTLCNRFAVGGRSALAATLALAVGTLVFPYATMFYGHVVTAAFLFAAFFLVEPQAGKGRLAGAGACCGLAVLTDVTAAPAALLLAAYALWSCRGRAWWLMAGAPLPLAALAAYQAAAFGGPLRSGYAFVSRPEFAEGMSHGLFGIGLPRPGVLAALLVGRSRGLLYTAPVLLLAFVGLGRRLVDDVRARRGEAPLAAAVVLFFLLATAGYYMWYGGSALGPRMVIPSLPFLCLGLPFAFRRPRPLIVGVLLALSVVNQLAATAVEPSAPLVDDVLGGYVYPHLLRGEVPLVPGASNAGAIFHLRGPASLLPLLALWAVALRMLLPLVPRSRPS